MLGQQVWSCGVFRMHVPVAVYWGLHWACTCAFDDSRMFSLVRIVLVLDCVRRQRGSLQPSLPWTEPGPRPVCHGCLCSGPTRCSAFSARLGHTSHQCLAEYGGDSTAVMQAVSCTCGVLCPQGWGAWMSVCVRVSASANAVNAQSLQWQRQHCWSVLQCWHGSHTGKGSRYFNLVGSTVRKQSQSGSDTHDSMLRCMPPR